MGWDPSSHGVLILTRFGNTDQLHVVATPGAERRQLSFESDPILTAGAIGTDVIFVSKDVGGNEVQQLYRLAQGRLVALNPKGQPTNDPLASRDGTLLGFSSSLRDGSTDDLYVVDPRVPGSTRRVAEVTGNWWMFKDFSPDRRMALVTDFISINDTRLFEMDLSSGRMTPLGVASNGAAINYLQAKYAPDGSLIVAADTGSDFIRLGRLDRATGAFHPLNPDTDRDLEDFAIAPDGSYIAYIVNDEGASRLKILDLSTGRVTGEPKLPMGQITNLSIASWGEIGFTFSGARSSQDVYSVNPKTLKVTRWTNSETGGLDPERNSEPKLVKLKSFDGLEISGFLYLPDPKRFPGPRPALMYFHGGPEYENRPGFQGADNYLINELGIAMFYPNVRGSTGSGKIFSSLDNGPFKREDAVKDAGAFIDALARNPSIDPKRIGVSGTSYGGYMSLATMVHYSAKLRAGIERVGISNFVTFLENTEPFRRDLRRPEYGDERDPVQRKQLIAISPLTGASRIRIPLMVEAGANDPRVPASEAKQVAAAVEQNGGKVWQLIGANEGHHFLKKENRDYQFLAEITFWREFLLSDASGATAKAVGTRP